MKIKIYNTLSRKLEEIEPTEQGETGIYSCGLTVYDFAHIGNLRKYVFDDLLRRSLKYFGYRLKSVMNITDVGHLTSDADEGEDKIEKGAKREGKDAYEIARFYEKAFLDDLKELQVETPDVLCRATEHIEDQINLIKTLEEKGFTYTIDDGVYFDTSKVSDYGKLAGLDIENLREGARVEINPQKRNPTDFALWKFTPSGARRQMEWPSPWAPPGSQGKVMGFPGWHIECSAMSVKYLGQPFAIHTGGVDHIPVHHTNEIAQSEAAAGKPLAKYFVHSEHLLEEGRKMAKSDGHFIRLKDVVEKGFDPLDLRFFYLRAHYRHKIDFSWNSLSAAKKARAKIVDFVLFLGADDSSSEQASYFDEVQSDFDAAIANDLDTPRALEVIFNAISHSNSEGFNGKAAKKFFEKVEEIFAIGLLKETFIEKRGEKGKYIKAGRDVSDGVLEVALEMSAAKEEGDFTRSDHLRSDLAAKGYQVEETKEFFYLKKI